MSLNLITKLLLGPIKKLFEKKYTYVVYIYIYK